MKKVILLIVVGLIAGAGGVGLRYIQDGSLGSLKGDTKNAGENLCLPLLNIQTQLPIPEYGITLESGIMSILKQGKAYAIVYPFPPGEPVAAGKQPTMKAAASGWDVYVSEGVISQKAPISIGVQSPSPFILIATDLSNREALIELVNQMRPVTKCSAKTSQLTIFPGKLDAWVSALTPEKKEHLDAALSAIAAPYREKKITMDYFAKTFECRNSILVKLISLLTPDEKDELLKLKYGTREAAVNPEVKKVFLEGTFPEAILFISNEYIDKRLEAEFSKTQQLEMTSSLGGSVSQLPDTGPQNCNELPIDQKWKQ